MNTALQFVKEMVAPSTPSQTALPTESNATSTTPFIILFGIVCLLCFIYNIGAVRLSWCYNTSIGTNFPLKIVYAFIAFFFSSIYYPFYAFFLDETCIQTPPITQIGGSRRHRKH